MWLHIGYYIKYSNQMESDHDTIVPVPNSFGLNQYLILLGSIISAFLNFELHDFKLQPVFGQNKEV